MTVAQTDFLKQTSGSQVKRNVVANYLGQVWTALMGLAFIPMYINYLGMEAYGLIGLFAVMQAWLALFDMGMTPTLSREMARYSAGARGPQSIRDLLRSLEVLCFSLAAVICLGVWAASGYLASDWLKAERLPTAVVAEALSAMGFVVALRFVEGIYRSSLLGLQRQVWYNGANAILITLRHGGALAVLARVSPTVQAFFLWHALISMLSIAVFAASVHRALDKSPFPAKFSRQALASVWKFAGALTSISFLSLLQGQVDKILLSRLLPLESFGRYALAATVAGALYMGIGPVTQGIYPRMVELSTRNDQAALISLYHQAAQLVTILTAPAAGVLSFFAGGVVFMWSGNASLAENTAPLLSVLAMGTFLNGLLWIPYECQLAHGWTSLNLKLESVAVIVLIPSIFWVVPHCGAMGVAWTWVALHAGYFLIDIQFMHRRLMPTEKWHWYFGDVILPTGGVIGVMLLAQQFQPANYQDRWHWFAFLLITGSIALIVSSALADHIRLRLLGIVRPNPRKF
jgi:O-antigen/teichoic acid export membrane protein